MIKGIRYATAGVLFYISVKIGGEDYVKDVINKVKEKIKSNKLV